MTEASHRRMAKARLSIAQVVPSLCLIGAGWLALPGTDIRADGLANTILRPNSNLLYTVEPSANMPVGFAWQLHVTSDGMVNLGSHGTVKVVGLTFAEAKAVIDKQIGLTEKNAKQATRPKLGESLQRIRQVGDRGEERKSEAPRTVEPEQEGGNKVESKSGMPKPATPEPIVDRENELRSEAHRAAKPGVVSASGYAPRNVVTPPPSTAALAYQSVNEAPTLPTVKPASAVEKVKLPPRMAKAPQSQMIRLSKGRSAKSASSDAMAPNLPTASGIDQAAYFAKGRSVHGAMPDAGAYVAPAPHECATVSLPPYVIHPPDILLIESTRSLRDQPINGQHLVRPDGTVGLGIYGSAYVAGLTLDQAKAIIGHEISQRVKDFDLRDLSVDVLAYNSKVYYVITDGGGFGEQVYRLPVTGHETVLDALAQINGLPPVASKKNIWVARPCAAAACGQMILPVDWKAIACNGLPETNYQIFPGDRIYVKADKLISIDSHIAKALSPIERLLGVTLLGSTTYNSITGRGFGFGN